MKVRVTEAHNGYSLGEIVEITGDGDGEIRPGDTGQGDRTYLAVSKIEPIIARPFDDRPAAGTIAVDVVPDLTSFRAKLAAHLREVADEIEGA